MDVRTVLGYASHPGVLAQAGAASAELLIAATQNDALDGTAIQLTALGTGIQTLTSNDFRVNVRDTLNGMKDRDWFIASANDLLDRKSVETLN